MKSTDYNNITKPHHRPSTPNTNNYDHNNTSTIKTPSPTNVIINLTSEFSREKSISKEDCKATRIRKDEEELQSKRSCIADHNKDSVSTDTSSCTSSYSHVDDMKTTNTSNGGIWRMDTTTPKELKSSSIFNKEQERCTTVSTSIIQDYDIQSSPGTKFVSELSEYIELEEGQYCVLAGIMDRQWCNIVTTAATDRKGTKN